MNMILLSDDCFLFTGLKNYFPNLIGVADFLTATPAKSDYVVLVDSRKDVTELYGIYKKIISSNHIFRSVRLDLSMSDKQHLRSKKYQQPAVRNINDLKDVISDISKETKPATHKMFSYSLNNSIKKIISQPGGSHIKKLSVKFKRTENNLCRIKVKVSQDLGHPSYCQEYVSIIDNNRMTLEIELPDECIRDEKQREEKDI